MTPEEWGELAARYAQQALDLYRAEDEDDSSERVLALQREYALATLRSYADTVDRVQLLRCACEVCSAGPEVRAIRDELAAPAIPHRGCREGRCSCDYLPVVEW